MELLNHFFLEEQFNVHFHSFLYLYYLFYLFLQ